MTDKEKRILKKLVEDPRGLLSPVDFINVIAEHNRKIVENLVSMGYVEEVPQDIDGIERGTTKSLNFYRASEKGIRQFSIWHERLWFSFKNNATLYVAVASIIFGLFSSVASFYTIQNSIDQRSISDLNFKPFVWIKTELNPQTSSDGIAIPPNFTIINHGPIDAIQTTVNFTVYEYDKESKKIPFSFSSRQEGQNFVIGTLQPLENRTLAIDNQLLMLYILGKVPSKSNIMEARVSYRRNSDKELFVDNYYYFTNLDGKWVSENDDSIKTFEYFEMKEALKTWKSDKYKYYKKLIGF